MVSNQLKTIQSGLKPATLLQSLSCKVDILHLEDTPSSKPAFFYLASQISTPVSRDLFPTRPALWETLLLALLHLPDCQASVRSDLKPLCCEKALHLSETVSTSHILALCLKLEELEKSLLISSPIGKLKFICIRFNPEFSATSVPGTQKTGG